MCQHFVTHLFACPDVAPQAATSTVSGTLDVFVAYALHRTRLQSSVTFAALYLLQRLKQRFPAARGSSGHRLFLSAFMIASKVICDDTYSNKSWSIVGQGMFALREVNQMEREMCAYLDWELNVDPACLAEFERSVRAVFAGPGPYHDIPLPLPTNKPPSITFGSSALDSAAKPPMVPARKHSAPAVYTVPHASQPKSMADAARRYPSPESSPESPATPSSSHSSTASPEPSPSPRTPESIEEAHAKIVQGGGSPYGAHALSHGHTATAAIKAAAMQRALQAEPGAPPHLSLDAGHYGVVQVEAPLKPRPHPARAIPIGGGRYMSRTDPYAIATPVAW
jgi:hypothetical protein